MSVFFRCNNCEFEKELEERFTKFIGRVVPCPKCKQNGEVVGNKPKEPEVVEEDFVEENTSETNTVEDADSVPSTQDSSSLRGVVTNFISEKGYGFIKNNDYPQGLFYHVSEVSENAPSAPLAGDSVSFEIVETDKGANAVNVCPELEFGVIVNYHKSKGFGFIGIGGNRENIFFHHTEYHCVTGRLPSKDTYVAFRMAPGKDGKICAEGVRPIQPLIGEVIRWHNNHGKLQPSSSDKLLNFSTSDFAYYSGRQARIDVGDTVSFLMLNDKFTKPVLVVKSFPLSRFADMGDEIAILTELAEKKTLKEDWRFRNQESDHPCPLLRNYIYYTFARLEDEDQTCSEEKKKIKIVEQETGPKIAVFDTGLVDRQYRELYAVFQENNKVAPGKPPWKIVGFCARGEYLDGNNYLTLFKTLPQRAEYFDNPADLLYDPKLRLDAVTNHITGDRGHRLPRSIQDRIPKDMKDPDQILSFLNNHLEMAIKRAKDRIRWNYKAAIPQYYPRSKRIQLLLPLCIDDPRKVDVALAVQRENEVYVGYTILELDWAYGNARLIARPDSDWLSPKEIDAQEEEDD